jgi:hypothetical protein
MYIFSEWIMDYTFTYMHNAHIQLSYKFNSPHVRSGVHGRIILKCILKK